MLDVAKRTRDSIILHISCTEYGIRQDEHNIYSPTLHTFHIIIEASVQRVVAIITIKVSNCSLSSPFTLGASILKVGQHNLVLLGGRMSDTSMVRCE